MKQAPPVDIMLECTALFNQEDTLAFFDFQLLPDGGGFVDGLCRIARPKRNLSGQEYVSLVFIIDTPDAASREHTAAAMKEFGSGTLEHMLPEIFSVVSVPPTGCGQETYIKQIDLMLKERLEVSQVFVSGRLYPAVRDVLQLKAGELGWWEDMRKEKPSAPVSDKTEEQISKSFIACLQEKLFGR
jgi:hypothetical protein